MRSWEKWLHKLLAAFIGGFAVVFAGAAVIQQRKAEPIAWKQLLDTSALAGATAAAAYLMKSPLPSNDEPPDKNEPPKT